jgi:glycopeptide antibiotics resistance protein
LASFDSDNGGGKDRWIDAWAGRTAALLSLAILAVTLFPFDFSLPATALRRVGPFLVWFAPISKGWLGWLENVLLFLPFGFALAWWAKRRNCPAMATWLLLLAAGLALSFLVEFLQLYIPRRDSSWDDVLMNSLGSLAGCWLFQFYGHGVLGFVEAALADITDVLDR